MLSVLKLGLHVCGEKTRFGRLSTMSPVQSVVSLRKTYGSHGCGLTAAGLTAAGLTAAACAAHGCIAYCWWCGGGGY